MSLIEALVLGIVQGLSEFLPISSSGHLILVPWLLGWGQNSLAFDVSLHVGTTVAVLVYFWHDWVNLLRGVARGLVDPSERSSPHWRLAWMIVLGSVPAAVAGAIAADTIEASIRQPWLVGVLLIVFGLLLGFADRVSQQTRDLDRFTVREALIVGVAQALALAPGVSRSGITMTAGLLLGLTREAAARFSFLLSMPVIVGAVVLQIYKLARAGGLQGEEAAFAVGILASGVVGILAIRFLLGYLRRRDTGVFVVYRVVVGALVVMISVL